MKHVYLLSLLVMLSLSVRAGDTTRTGYTNEPYNALKIGATTISIFMLPTMQVGFEHRWQKFSWQATAGFIIPKHYSIDDTISGTALGYLLRVEGRIHKHTPAHSGVYLGVSLFYDWFKYPYEGWLDASPGSQGFDSSYHDDYLLLKHTVGCVVSFGGHHYIGKHLDIEMSAGLGPKVMFTSQQGCAAPDKRFISKEPNFYDIEGLLGTTWSIAIQGQLSVAYKLKR